MPSEAPVLARWLDHFFASYYRHRPVNATFIGRHDYDHRLPDFSDNGVGDTLAEMRELLEQAQEVDTASLTPMEALDFRLAQGFLKIQLWEYQSEHFQRGNPSVYTGEAVFGVMALFLSTGAPLTERVEAATKRMEDVSILLAQGRKNVTQAPLAWTERALRECEGALAFLTEGIDLLRDRFKRGKSCKLRRVSKYWH